MEEPRPCTCCRRWIKPGSTVCDLCRVAFSFTQLVSDPRLNNGNVQLAINVCYRALGEISCILSGGQAAGGLVKGKGKGPSPVFSGGTPATGVSPAPLFGTLRPLRPVPEEGRATSPGSPGEGGALQRATSSGSGERASEPNRGVSPASSGETPVVVLKRPKIDQAEHLSSCTAGAAGTAGSFEETQAARPPLERRRHLSSSGKGGTSQPAAAARPDPVEQELPKKKKKSKGKKHRERGRERAAQWRQKIPTGDTEESS